MTSVIMIHVGGTGGVTWSIARSIQIHARITRGVVFIRAIFFHIFMFDLHDHYDPFSYFFNVRLTRYNKLLHCLAWGVL